MKCKEGETVLLREGDGVCRWMKILSASVARTGMQEVTVRPCDQYGRAKARRVIIGANAVIEQIL
jgi:hypothetical protein